jgi:AraC-like DNA-binding protein
LLRFFKKGAVHGIHPRLFDPEKPWSQSVNICTKPVKARLTSLSSPDAWLTAIADPKNRVGIDFHHVPPFYTARHGWINQPAPLSQHLLYHVVKGSFRISEGGREFSVEPGALLWIPPWTSFRCWLPGSEPASFHRFRLDVRNRRDNTLILRGAPLITREVHSLQRWFEEIIRAAHHGAGSWQLRAALLGLFAEALVPQTPPAGAGLNTIQREALEQLVHRDARVQVTPAQLASHLGLSADYFARLFRKAYGIPPRAWIVRERIKMAAVRLLESHLNVGEVAEEFGYRDIFFFSRQFKQVTGQSPKDYRSRR